MKLSKQIENIAKVTALKRHFSPGIESAFCTSLDDPGFLDRLVISLNSGSDDTFSDVSGFLGDEVKNTTSDRRACACRLTRTIARRIHQFLPLRPELRICRH